MKIQLKKDVLVETTDSRNEGIYDRQLKKWQTVNVEKINVNRATANIVTYEGDTLWDVPVDAFDTV
jgi:hypothetical protein